MRFCLGLTTALMMSAMAGFLAADDTDNPKKDDDDPVAKAMSQIAQLGPGVHKIKTDNKGRIKSCIIVGQSRISTVLGKAKGLETARQRAQLAAKAEFVKWLKERVSVHEKTEDEQILFLEGQEGNDSDALKESGKAVEKTTKKMESISESLVRGIELLHSEVSDKDKTYTLVYGWDAKTAEATKKARKDLNEESKDGTTKKESGTDASQGKAGERKGTEGIKALDKKIEDKKATSKDAKKFID